MQYPSNKDWTFMRREVQKFMQDTITIYTVTKTYTNASGVSQVRTAIASGVKAQFYDATAAEKRLLQTLVDVGTENIQVAKLMLPNTTTLTSDHEVEVNGNGKYWNVHSSNSDQEYKAAVTALLYRKLVNGALIE